MEAFDICIYRRMLKCEINIRTERMTNEEVLGKRGIGRKQMWLDNVRRLMGSVVDKRVKKENERWHPVRSLNIKDKYHL